MKQKPKILIVEDEPALLERYKLILERPKANWIKDNEIDGFQVDAVPISDEARKLIKKAQSNHQPYEAVLLDLKLPRTYKELELDIADEEQGRNLLKEITLHSETAVVILTGHPKTKNLIYAIQFGAVDFLVKPLLDRESELFIRMVKAVGINREAIHKKLQIKQLVKYKDLDYKEKHEHIAKDITEMTHEISERINELSNIFFHRYGLVQSQDAEDPVCNSLTMVKKLCDKIVKVIWDESKEINTAEFKFIDIKEVLFLEVFKIRPCYLQHDVDLEIEIKDDLKTKTVESSIRDIIAELLFSTLEKCTETNKVKLYARYNDDGTDIIISIDAPDEVIPKEVKAYLKKGGCLSEELKSRWCNIVLLRTLARDIGVRIQINKQKNRNNISLLIPVILDE